MNINSRLHDIVSYANIALLTTLEFLITAYLLFSKAQIAKIRIQVPKSKSYLAVSDVMHCCIVNKKVKKIFLVLLNSSV